MKTELCIFCRDSGCGLAYKKGHILIHEGQLNQGCYFILSGVVKIYSQCENGREIIHGLLTAGELIGLSSLTEASLSPYSAQVLEDAQACFMNSQRIVDQIRTEPAFLRVLAQKITRIQEEAYHQKDDLINCKVRERMAKCLLGLTEEFGESVSDGKRINLRLSREELASLVGVAPETAIRFLSEFKKNLLISEADHRLIIHSEDGLRNFCN